MTNWLRRVRGTIGMGLTWAFGWGVAGVLIGVASIFLPWLPWDQFFEVFDAPLPAFAVPGFFAGVFFSTVVGIAGRRRTLRELSLRRMAAWGTLAGVLLTAFPFALVAVGLASTEGSSVGAWKSAAVIFGPFIFLSAISAAATLKIARMAEHREFGDSGDDVTDDAFIEGESHALLGAGRSVGTREARPEGQHARPDPASRRGENQ